MNYSENGTWQCLVIGQRLSYIPQFSSTSLSNPSGRSLTDSSIASANRYSWTFLRRLSLSDSCPSDDGGSFLLIFSRTSLNFSTCFSTLARSPVLCSDLFHLQQMQNIFKPHIKNVCQHVREPQRENR